MLRLPRAMRTSQSLLLAGVFLVSACGLGADRSSGLDPNADNREVLCAPTGRALVDTGVYIGPDGCESVSLVASEEGNYRVLSVGWPTYGDEDLLVRIENQTTGDVELEEFYVGDPEFVLFVGEYSLGGLEVVEGANQFSYEIRRRTPDGREGVLLEQATFSLTVL